MEASYSCACGPTYATVIGAVSPHYIIGIALGAGVYGFFMLCEGAFKVQRDIPPWFIW